MNVCDWAESRWFVPETGEPIRLRAWQRAVLLAMFPADDSLPEHETFLLSTVKKGGKTTTNAVATLYAALTFPAPETVYCVANDEAQAQERVFDLVSKAVRAMGLVREGAAVVSKSESCSRRRAVGSWRSQLTSPARRGRSSACRRGRSCGRSGSRGTSGCGRS